MSRVGYWCPLKIIEKYNQMFNGKSCFKFQNNTWAVVVIPVHLWLHSKRVIILAALLTGWPQPFLSLADTVCSSGLRSPVETAGPSLVRCPASSSGLLAASLPQPSALRGKKMKQKKWFYKIKNICRHLRSNKYQWVWNQWSLRKCGF